MKKKNVFTLLLVLLMFQVLFAQTTEKTTLSEDKFELVQWLSSCQSISYLVLSERDHGTKEFLISKGSRWYNNGYRNFIELQETDTLLTDRVREDISTLLQLYSKVFNDSEFRTKPETPLALSFAKQVLKNSIYPALICAE